MPQAVICEKVTPKGVMVGGDEVALIAGGAVPARRNNGHMLAVVLAE